MGDGPVENTTAAGKHAILDVSSQIENHVVSGIASWILADNRLDLLISLAQRVACLVVEGPSDS